MPGSRGSAPLAPQPRLVDCSLQFYTAVSAALWNLGLILLGSAVGMNFESLTRFMKQYSIVMWLLIAAVVGFFVVRAILKKRREQDAG